VFIYDSDAEPDPDSTDHPDADSDIDFYLMRIRSDFSSGDAVRIQILASK
jgi:hypothetical protein